LGNKQLKKNKNKNKNKNQENNSKNAFILSYSVLQRRHLDSSVSSWSHQSGKDTDAWCVGPAFEMVRALGTQGQAEGTASGHEGGETLEQAAQRHRG